MKGGGLMGFVLLSIVASVVVVIACLVRHRRRRIERESLAQQLSDALEALGL